MDPENGDRPSFIKRLFNRLRLLTAPESAAELEHEIQELIDDGREHGLIPARLETMINSVLDFRDTVAREIMTPATDMVSIADDTPFDQIVETIIDRGFSRIPVFTGSIDHIIGVIYAKDLLRHLEVSPQPTAGELVRPAFFAMEGRKVLDLLRDFQARKVHLVIITDEFGGVRGLVTLEDVLEEIVGEINDESDTGTPLWKKIDSNAMLTDAKVSIREVEDFFHLSLPEGPYESAGGMILHKLGHLPSPGTVLRENGLRLEVIAASKRRIEKIKISRKPVEEE